MKKIAIVGLGWLGMPLARLLIKRGIQVVGTKTTSDGVDAGRMSGIECYQLELIPELICAPDNLDKILQVDALVITLPARRIAEEGERYIESVQRLVDSALIHSVPRIIFTSSTSVYGQIHGCINEDACLNPITATGKTLAELEQWLHQLPNTSVDVLRLAGLVGNERHPGRFLAGKTGVKGGAQGVNLVHQNDVIAAIELLLNQSRGGHIYNICASLHPKKCEFYPACSRALHLIPPEFIEGAPGQPERLVDGSRICRELGFKYQYADPMRMLIS